MTEKKLLIIDDDTLFRESIVELLSVHDYVVFGAANGEEGIQLCEKLNMDVVLLDHNLPDAKGIDLCGPILSHNERTKIIFITAYPSFNNAVQALKSGAHDYLSKPFEVEELELAIQKAFRTVGLEKVEQVQSYKNRIDRSETVLIGHHGAMKKVQQLVDLAATNKASTLITGETGTGKRIVAKSIHYRGSYSNTPFIEINCAALPENLIEAELFGYEKGAFTGAINTRKGIFEMAEGGTLFLDEIGELPVHLQSKLLGVLDDNKVKRIGGERMRPIDVRIIGATNVVLEEAIKKKEFRKDLYYRFSVLQIHVPPLREHPEDISELCLHFINNFSPEANIELPIAEIDKLYNYHWPGNIRELKNIIERAVILRQDRNIQPSQFINHTSFPMSKSAPADLDMAEPAIMSLKEMEKRYIQHTLEQTDRNQTKSAKLLGISRSTLLRKLKNYNIE